MPDPTARAAHPLRRLYRYAAAWRGRIVVASVHSVVNKLLDLAPPALIGTALDVVVRREDSLLAGLGLPGVREQLLVLTGITVLVWVGESLFEYLHLVAWRDLAQGIEHEIRLDAWRSVARMEQGFFDDRSAGGLLAVLSDDVNQLERFLDGGANAIIQMATTVLLVGGLFVTVSPVVGALALIPVPAVILGSLWFQRRIARRYADVRERAGDLSGELASAVSGIATVRSFTAEDWQERHLDRASDDYRQANRAAIRLSSAFSPLIRMVILAGFVTVMLVGGFQVEDGALAAGAYAMLVFMTQRLLWPLTNLGQVLDLYQRAMASVRRILDLVDLEPSIVSGDRRLALDAVDGRIRFEALRFGYRSGHPVLDDVTIDVAPGTLHAVVGPTGSGKTTLVRLLLRLHDVCTDDDAPWSGRVLLDDVEVPAYDLGDLRDAIALVSQEVHLFHATIRENVAFGLAGRMSPDAVAMERIVEAARAAEALDFIEALPDGWETIVGEHGRKLSGGQRQRLAMARAILKDAPILVLDEATSAVDNETEAAMQRSLARACADRTVIVIAHRLSTIRHADHVDVLSAGRVVERGTHDELVRADGLYARLWRVQTGENDEAAAAHGGDASRP